MLGAGINTGHVVGGAQQNADVVGSAVASPVAESGSLNMVATDNTLNVDALPPINVALASAPQATVDANPSFAQYISQQLSRLGSFFKGFVADSLNSLASYPLMKPVAMGLAGVMSWVGVENFNPSVAKGDIIVFDTMTDPTNRVTTAGSFANIADQAETVMNGLISIGHRGIVTGPAWYQLDIAVIPVKSDGESLQDMGKFQEFEFGIANHNSPSNFSIDSVVGRSGYPAPDNLYLFDDPINSNYMNSIGLTQDGRNIYNLSFRFQLDTVQGEISQTSFYGDSRDIFDALMFVNHSNNLGYTLGTSVDGLSDLDFGPVSTYGERYNFTHPNARLTYLTSVPEPSGMFFAGALVIGLTLTYRGKRDN